MTATTTPPTTAPTSPSFFGKALRQKRFSFGFTVTLLVVAFVVIAPHFAPYGEHETAGLPFAKDGVFGTDYLGQDVLSRVMHGGQEVLLISVLATVFGMVLGILIGVVAAYSGGWWDEVIMRLNDVVLAFPQILLALVVLTALQSPSAWAIALDRSAVTVAARRVTSREAMAARSSRSATSDPVHSWTSVSTTQKLPST